MDSFMSALQIALLVLAGASAIVCVWGATRPTGYFKTDDMEGEQ